MLPSDPATLPAVATPAVPAEAAAPTQPLPPAPRVRTWPAALALLFVSPGIAEMLSGSTPPLRFIQPFALIALPTLYGFSALLIREIMVRRALGWGNALLMGAAFGIFQEALIVQTWFNEGAAASPSHSQGTYGVAFGTGWDWGLNVTAYHSFISITAPLILIGLLFPRQAPLPWLGRKRIIAMVIWMFVVLGALAYAVAFRHVTGQGDHGPPLVPYLFTAGLTVLAMLLGAFVRFPVPRPATPARRAPRLWTVRLTIGGLIAVYFFGTSGILPATHLPAIVNAAFGVALFGFSVWRVRTWSARPDWGDRHWLAVVTGLVLYFTVLWGPVVEFAARLPDEQGLVLADVIALVALLLFDRRLKRRAITGD